MSVSTQNRRQFLANSLAASAGLFALHGQARASVQSSWAALAYSPSRRSAHMVWNGEDRASIERTGLDAINAKDGLIAVSASGTWMALSHTGTGGWGSGIGSSLFAAFQQAQANCASGNQGNKGEIIAAVYGGPGGVDFDVKYDSQFSDTQRSLLEAAVHSARFRMAAPQVTSRIGAIARQHFYFHELVGKSFIRGYEPSPDRMTALMNAQLVYLDTIHHPDLELNAYHEDVNYWAKAPVGRVLMPYGTSVAADIRGKFEVKVNTKWLASGGHGSDTFVWAGVLAHEYMHNLGHMHGQDEYGDHLQINAIQLLVHTMGAYKKGQVCPDFACDCRKMWR